jgi:hypothetical protein
MFSRTKIALSVAMVLGVLGTASAALASNEHDDSVGGRDAARQVGNPLPWWWNSADGGRAAFAYQPAKHAPTVRAVKH